MSRKLQRIKRARKRHQKALQRRLLVTSIDDLIRPFGGCTMALGPLAVGVQGDARTYGISVIIRLSDLTQMLEASNLITNRVAEVTRVLLDI